MSVVCATCGSRNRDKAMFCSGCAGRLPGFMPSGPSALDAVKTGRAAPISPFDAPRSPLDAPFSRPRAASLALLPAETPAFWLRLGLLALAMSVAFIGWYLYVTRDVAGPSWWPKLNTAAPATEAKAPPSEKAVAAVPAPAPAQAPAPEPARRPAADRCTRCTRRGRAHCPCNARRCGAFADQHGKICGRRASFQSARRRACGARSRHPAASDAASVRACMGPRRPRASDRARSRAAGRVCARTGVDARRSWSADRARSRTAVRFAAHARVEPGRPRPADRAGSGPAGQLIPRARMAADDSGPPIAIGPGPLVNPVRAPRPR